MSKKSRTEITEKLSALKPDEPTRTRSRAVRKSSAIKVQVKEGLSLQDTQPSPAPQRYIPPPMIAMYSVPSEVYRAVYEGWFQIVRNYSGMVGEYNRVFLYSLSHFKNPNRWDRS